MSAPLKIADDQTYTGARGINEKYGALNGYSLLEAAEVSLAKEINDKGIAACPMSFRALLLMLNQLEQIETHQADTLCSVNDDTEGIVGKLNETNRLLRELLDALKSK